MGCQESRESGGPAPREDTVFWNGDKTCIHKPLTNQTEENNFWTKEQRAGSSQVEEHGLEVKDPSSKNLRLHSVEWAAWTGGSRERQGAFHAKDWEPFGPS